MLGTASEGEDTRVLKDVMAQWRQTDGPQSRGQERTGWRRQDHGSLGVAGREGEGESNGRTGRVGVQGKGWQLFEDPMGAQGTRPHSGAEENHRRVSCGGVTR